MNKNIDYIKDLILAIPDFPKPGIMFRDITPIFKNPQAIEDLVEHMVNMLKDVDIDVIVAAESRGFLFGLPLAMKLKKPFVLVRKPNKLPREVYKQSFDLEYGTSVVELQVDDLSPGQKVLIVDDLLATGGTVEAIEKLIEKAQALPVASIFVIELTNLKGASKLKSKVYSVFNY